MNWIRRLLERFNPPAPVVPAEPGRGVSTELVEAEWRSAVEIARLTAYQEGLAMGELRGRQELANEIEAAFGGVVTQPDAVLIRQRQLH